MSINPNDIADKSREAIHNMRKTARAFYEPQLRDLNLGAEQIKKQNLDQLEQSLLRVNDAISNPESFGTFGVKLTAEGSALIAKAKSESAVELGALPILLERKKLILERINRIRGKKKIENLQDLVKEVSDPEIRKRLQNEVSELNSESERIRIQREEVEKVQRQQELEENKELTELARKTEMFERRSKVWLSFLEKESAASLIGGVLLLVISCSLITAMFMNPVMIGVLKIFKVASQDSSGIIINSDILNNAFLLLLGYFFGQITSKASNGSNKTE